ncbi:pyrroloquinoline quinone biosynthesis protein PqqD [Paracoccus sanguinis]|nr:pyrroloquinoline quinone biosynthesis protein PqqD [Paracoccus sanguinis]
MPPPPDPPLEGKTVPYLPRGVRLADDPVRGLRVLQAPERALQLDPAGEAILTSLDGRTLDEIVAELAARYDAPEAVILRDVASFLDDLIARRMVFVRSA